jgi:hypothetical protein
VLATLAFRIPPDRLDQVLGHVTAYPLTEEFEKAWDRLPRIRLNSGRPGTPKYASLAAALRAVTARPVRLFGRWDLSEAEQVAGARAPADDRADRPAAATHRRGRLGAPGPPCQRELRHSTPINH